jgi:hypothetical protein
MNYRNVSEVPGASPALRAAFAARGIAVYANAMPPRARKTYVQVFVMDDGSIKPASYAVVGECVRAAKEAA